MCIVHPETLFLDPKKGPSMRNKGLACPKIHMAEMMESLKHRMGGKIGI